MCRRVSGGPTGALLPRGGALEYPPECFEVTCLRARSAPAAACSATSTTGSRQRTWSHTKTPCQPTSSASPARRATSAGSASWSKSGRNRPERTRATLRDHGDQMRARLGRAATKPAWGRPRTHADLVLRGKGDARFHLGCEGPSARPPRACVGRDAVVCPRAELAPALGCERAWRHEVAASKRPRNRLSGDFLATHLARFGSVEPNICLRAAVYGTEGHRSESCRAR